MMILPVILLVAGVLFIVLLLVVIYEIMKGCRLGKDASEHIKKNYNVGITASVYPRVRKELLQYVGGFGNEENMKSGLSPKNSPKNSLTSTARRKCKP